MNFEKVISILKDELKSMKMQRDVYKKRWAALLLNIENCHKKFEKQSELLRKLKEAYDRCGSSAEFEVEAGELLEKEKRI